jgi:hypothetical protein
MSALNNNNSKILQKNNSYPSSVVDSNETSILQPYISNHKSYPAQIALAKKLDSSCKDLLSIISSNKYKNAEAILLIAINKVKSSSILFWYLREWYAIVLALLDEQKYLHKGFIVRNYHRIESQEYFQERTKPRFKSDNYKNEEEFECTAISYEGVLYELKQTKVANAYSLFKIQLLLFRLNNQYIIQ